MFRRRLRRRSPKFFFLTGVVVTLLIAIPLYQFYIIKKNVNTAVETAVQKVKEENQFLGEKSKAVLVEETIEQGKRIELSKVKEIETSETVIPTNAVTDKNSLGNKIARIKLEKGTIVSEEMLINYLDTLTDDLRRQDFFNIRVAEDLESGSYVDIRLKRPNGVDLVVAAKKKLEKRGDTVVEKVVQTMKNIEEEEKKNKNKEENSKTIMIPTTWFNITEQDRINLNLAGLEQILNGAELYTTVYVDPENQKKAEVTYKVDEKVLAMIENNTQVMEFLEKFIQEKTIEKIQQSQEMKDRENGNQNTSEGSNSSENN